MRRGARFSSFRNTSGSQSIERVYDYGEIEREAKASSREKRDQSKFSAVVIFHNFYFSFYSAVAAVFVFQCEKVKKSIEEWKVY